MPSPSPTAPVISDYGNGRFVFSNDQVHEGPMMIIGEDISGFSIHLWKVSDRSAISKKDFDLVLNAVHRPDLVIVGVGTAMNHPYMDLRRELNAEGLPAEILTTSAACRTWNLLLSEGRKIALAVLEVSEKG